jgi:LysR family nod box-dependent transcriptional activator
MENKYSEGMQGRTSPTKKRRQAMRFNRLDLNLLLALDALLEEQNITRAAARVNVSQSAMSGMLARCASFSRTTCWPPSAATWN